MKALKGKVKGFRVGKKNFKGVRLKATLRPAPSAIRLVLSVKLGCDDVYVFSIGLQKDLRRRKDQKKYLVRISVVLLKSFEPGNDGLRAHSLLRQLIYGRY
jgi:hypothetical protein